MPDRTTDDAHRAVEQLAHWAEYCRTRPVDGIHKQVETIRDAIEDALTPDEARELVDAAPAHLSAPLLAKLRRIAGDS
jgi:hypothetical protein